ncbi:hypothetical protein BZG01_13940 [Labilibaculum manganireducens]|uniref:Uncharacterized protein n=1 Tax=Labilibaculum manganireducens TaxID=1940525 RepID=A0A2N3I3A5_9BACT|nr:hypothetical protein [Labilibaculum manganireducens]PKQ64776.1 hypothetical protein BZG01_13940 [Labilibaculum manganireducens]
MMILKLLAPIILFAIAILQGLFAEKINKIKWLKITLICLLLGSLTVGLIIISLDEKNANNFSKQQKDNIDSLRIENAQLKNNLDSLHRALTKGMDDRSLQEIELNKKVSELNIKLEPFVKLALTKYPAYDLQSALNKIAQDIENAKKLAEPPILIPNAQEISRDKTGLNMLLQFKLSKNQSLGQIIFYAEIEDGSTAKIVEFWPSTKGGAFNSGPDSKMIAPDGKSSRLIYSLIGAGNPTFDLKVTKAVTVRITSNYLPEPFITKIE